MEDVRLTKSDIIEAVGRRVYKRGLDYVPTRTHLRDVAPNRARAVVVGTRAYVSTFEFADGAFSGQCTCPASMGRFACKHVVATALAYMADPMPRSDTGIVHAFVESMSREDLIATIIGQSVDSEPLFASLLKGAVLNGVELSHSAGSLRSAVFGCIAVAMGGEDDPDPAIDDALQMLKVHMTPAMAPAVADVARAAAAELSSHGKLSRYGDEPDCRRYWDRDDDDHDAAEPEPEIDEAVEFIRIHAESEKLCGASPGFVAARAFDLVMESEFARERTEIYVSVFGEEIRQKLGVMPPKSRFRS